MPTKLDPKMQEALKKLLASTAAAKKAADSAAAVGKKAIKGAGELDAAAEKK